MTLPGLSGSFILILLGNYVLLLVDSVNALYDTFSEVFSGDFSFVKNSERIQILKILGVFTLGSVTGLVTFSHLLSYVLKHFKATTTAVLLGFITGSLGVLWPWKRTVFKVDEAGNPLLDSNGDKIILNYKRHLPQMAEAETWWAILFILLGILVLLILDWYGNNRKKMNRFGLLGRNISYSFSQGYFTQKFKDLGLDDHSYENFDLQKIEELKNVLAQDNLRGLNVTIPYKQEVIPYLDELDAKAAKIGAVNTIQFTENGLKGFNTDAYGFQKSLEPFLKPHHKNALILGTGGASKAVRFVLDELGIANTYVSRSKRDGQYTYDELDETTIKKTP